MKKDSKAKILVLIVVFIFSLKLFWDIITVIFGYSKLYAVFQFSFSAYFTIFSIVLTKDMEYFKNLWERNEKIRKLTDKILHLSGKFMVWFPRIILSIVEVIFNGDLEKEIAHNKIEAQKKIEEYDNMPVAARIILPVGVLVLVMIVLVCFNVFSEQVLSWIQEVMNTLVSTVGVFVIAMNVKETK